MRARISAGQLLLAAALTLAACAGPGPATTVVVRAVSTDLTAPLLAALADAYRGVHPNVTLTLTTAEPAALADDLAAGRAELGLLASPPAGLFATPLAYARFTVIAHPAAPVEALTAAQLRDVFAGRARDWAQAGGGSGAVQVVSREAGSDAAQAFEAAVLDGAALRGEALVAPSWEAMTAAVRETPGAVGYLPAAEAPSGLKVLRTEAVLRALVVAAAPMEPSGAARDFLAWAQGPAGQRVAARLGYDSYAAP